MRQENLPHPGAMGAPITPCFLGELVLQPKEQSAGACPPPSTTRAGPSMRPALGLRVGSDVVFIVSQTTKG
jgi:hypothetical protein